MNRPSLPRPTLLPGLHLLWRDRKTIQLGTDPAQAVVVEFAHPAATRLLELLDGSRTEALIATEMARIGMSGEDVRVALAALAEAGLVVAAHTLMPSALPAEQRRRVASEAAALALRFRERPASPAAILRRRFSSKVIIAGTGAFARILAPALLEAGVGMVGQITEPGSPPTALTTGSVAEPGSLPVAATHHNQADAPAGRAPIIRTQNAFVVQIGRMARVTLSGRNRLPHLAIGVRDGVAIVGPLVPATGGPCLRCLDLHRTDRDPAWPRLREQLDEKQADPAPCTSATLLTATGLAAGEVLTYLDGGTPATIGATVEVNGTSPWRRRHWTPHPACDCTRRKR